MLHLMFLYSRQIVHMKRSESFTLSKRQSRAQLNTLERKLQTRSGKLDSFENHDEVEIRSSNESVEQKVTERIASTKNSRKISRKLSRAVVETETELELLITEINGLKEQLSKVMWQSRAHILSHANAGSTAT